MAKDDYVIVSWPIILSTDRAANFGRGLQGREEMGIHARSAYVYD
jgi:hypothetical protein